MCLQTIVCLFCLLIFQLTESGTGDVDKKTTTMPVNHMHKRKLQRLQRTPLRIQSSPVPLPAVSVKGSKDPSLLTIEDLPMIRSRVCDCTQECIRRNEGEGGGGVVPTVGTVFSRVSAHGRLKLTAK